MRGFFHRAGAVFDRDVPEGDQLGAGGVADRDSCNRPVEGSGKSKAGIFSQFEVQRGLPIQMLVKHFTQVGELWQLNADIRAMVQHRQLNLLQDFSHLGTFDVIFCRNVLIYFDQDAKAAIFDRLAKAIEPDGVLTLGAAESVVGISDAFKPFPERRGLYRPNTARAVRAGAAATTSRRGSCCGTR